MPVELNQSEIIDKLKRIQKRKNIKNAILGWNKDLDLTEVVSFLKNNGAEVYLWMPVFSELESLADFSPIIGRDNKKTAINYDAGNGEKFAFCCPADPGNIATFIKVVETHYNVKNYDGVFLDKIRYPSFFGGIDSIVNCYCGFCRSTYDVPLSSKLQSNDCINPLGIASYRNLVYEMNAAYKELFDYKCDAVFNSLKTICTYLRAKGLKIGFDLFAPFLAYFVGQDYHRLLQLADFVKPMFYAVTNAPAGLPFEINCYAKAFDDNTENAKKRKKVFLDKVGYGDAFINSEISGIRNIIDSDNLKTMLYAGTELNYKEGIANVTEEYIRESATKLKGADGIVASWDLNTMMDSHIDCLLDHIGV